MEQTIEEYGVGVVILVVGIAVISVLSSIFAYL